MSTENRGGRALLGLGLLIWVGWMAWPSSAPLRERASLPKAFVSVSPGQAASPTLASIGGLPGPRLRGSANFLDPALEIKPEQTAEQEASKRDAQLVEGAINLKTGNFFHATEAYLQVLASDPNNVVALRGIQAVRSGASSPDLATDGEPAVLKRNLLEDLGREAEDAQSAGRFQEAVNAVNLYLRVPHEEGPETEHMREIQNGAMLSLAAARGDFVPQLTVSPPVLEREPAEAD